MKQTLAAVYGKVAQRFPSDLQSYIWAGLTTSMVRARLLKVLASEAVYAVETDSVILKGKLPTGEGLGDWKLREEFPKGVFFSETQHFDLASRGAEEREIPASLQSRRGERRFQEARLPRRPERDDRHGPVPEVRQVPKPLPGHPVRLLRRRGGGPAGELPGDPAVRDVGLGGPGGGARAAGGTGPWGRRECGVPAGEALD